MICDFCHFERQNRKKCQVFFRKIGLNPVILLECPVKRKFRSGKPRYDQQRNIYICNKKFVY